MEIAGKSITIESLDSASMERARLRQGTLTKPAGSLGLLEDISIRICGIRREIPASLGEKVVILCAADHGVVEEGVSAYPQEVTGQMLLNFAGGGAAINVLAKHAGARVVVVDVGTRSEVGNPAVIRRKIRRGTANFAWGPAMSRAEAEQAIGVGIETAEQEIGKGAGLIATGDMGIGNTTAASALIAALSGLPVRSLVGRGTGIDDASLEKKVEVIERALELNSPSSDDPLDALSKVGGLEIGALAGVMLACAVHRVPVVVDGFISGAAALLASRIDKAVVDYLFASHLSEEPGHRLVLGELGLKQFIDLEMRLGEGTGAVLAISVIEAAVKILVEMSTFEEAGVSRKSEKAETEK
jgi:nicotinate-nucleotide--dimethylbenzimidazole phosphoribosyltransferase